MTLVHINAANAIRLANAKNSRNETTRLVNVPIKETTAGVEMTTINETIGINVETMGKETDVDIEIVTTSHTTIGIVQSVQIQISVSVKSATNVMLPAPVVEDNQNPEMMDKETVEIIKTTTHTMIGIAPSVQIQISVSGKTATNVMNLGQAPLAKVDKGQIQSIIVQTTEVEEAIEEMMEAEEVNVQTTEVEEVNVQTIGIEEVLGKTTEAKAANVRIIEAENQIHSSVEQGGKVRTTHITDPQRK